MAKKKADSTAPPGLERDLKRLAQQAAHRDTGVKPSAFKHGGRPVATKTTKKGKSK